MFRAGSRRSGVALRASPTRRFPSSPGDLSKVERNEARCAGVRDRMQAYLLPGQRAELYLVFDDSVHPCFAD
jgi:hypothetical protein